MSRCSVCDHERRKAIERHLAGDQGLGDLISKSSTRLRDPSGRAEKLSWAASDSFG